MKRGGLRVTASEVDRGEFIKPCFGYRFEHDGRVAVLAGDVRHNSSVIKPCSIKPDRRSPSTPTLFASATNKSLRRQPTNRCRNETSYRRPLAVGEDLAAFDIGESISVRRSRVQHQPVLAPSTSSQGSDVSSAPH